MHSSTAGGAALWDRITAEHATAKDLARVHLRSIGVKYAHPDDGWVRRNPDGSGRHSRSWYPLFDDHPEAGDLVAFGYPPTAEHAQLEYTAEGGLRAAEGYRIVRLTSITRKPTILAHGLNVDMEFVFEGQTWPAEERTWLRRRPVRGRKKVRRG